VTYSSIKVTELCPNDIITLIDVVLIEANKAASIGVCAWLAVGAEVNTAEAAGRVGVTAREAAVMPDLAGGTAWDFGGTVIGATSGGGTKVNVGGVTFETGGPTFAGALVVGGTAVGPVGGAIGPDVVFGCVAPAVAVPTPFDTAGDV
jgi:hypothetical protein